MKQIKSAEARAYANARVWERHGIANEVMYENNAKIKRDTQLLSLLDKRNGLVVDLAMASYKKQDTKKLEESEKILLAEISQKLAVYNMKISDLEFNPHCKKCGDTGKVLGADCDCFKNFMFEYLASRLSCKQGEIGFLNAKKFANKHCELIKFYDNFESYCARYPDVNKKIIFMRGNVGSGKSYLAKVALEELIAKGNSGLFINAFSLFDVFIKHLYNSTSFTPSHIVEEEYDLLAKVDILVCDDLGAEILKNKNMKSYFLNLIDTRIQNQKLTIFTTNLNNESIIERYGERFFSRITSASTAIMEMSSSVDLRKETK